MTKNLYIGYFNGKFKMHVKRCMAYSVKQAYLLMCKKIAKEAGVPDSVVIDHFQMGDNCAVKLEIEYDEVDE